MNRATRILPLLLAATLLAGCEQVSEYTGELPDLKLVLYSFVRPDSMVRVDVHQTRYFSNNSSELPREVTGEVHVNGQLAGTLYPTPRSPWELAVQHVADVYPRPGDRVRVTARAEGMPEASAEVTVPADTVPIRVDTTLLGNPGKLERVHYTLHINDTARERHYYRLIVETETYEVVDGERYNSTRHYAFSPENDPLLVGSNNTWINEDVVPNRYHIFTNETFEGTGYTMRVSAGARNTTRFEYAHDGQTIGQRNVMKHHVTVVRIDEDTYLHLKSLMLLEMGEGVMEPVQVHANVHGGVGIIGYAVYSTVTFEMPEVHVQESGYIN
ncbi:MAG: DUF4249 domain-containing protein [Odoribacteraceae bacterium]|jgi:hypothetical protein|nr:DUF4249 domain-containing protein [Odoribacteraceae bacterium]